MSAGSQDNPKHLLNLFLSGLLLNMVVTCSVLFLADCASFAPLLTFDSGGYNALNKILLGEKKEDQTRERHHDCRAH